MFRLFRKRRTEIAAGLTIYNGLFRFVAVEQNDKGSLLINCALADTVSDGKYQYRDVFEKLSDFLKRDRPALTVSMPLSETIVKVLQLPMDIDNARQMLRYEIERFFPVNKDEVLFDVAEVEYPFAEKYDMQHYLVAVTKQKNVDMLLSTAKRYDFSIECIEPAQVALERAISVYARKNAVIYVYVGSSYIQYMLSWHNNAIFYRSSDFDNYEQTDSSIGSTVIENFARELKLFIEDASAETKIIAKSVVLFGSSADPSICRKLEQQIPELDFEYINIIELNTIEMDDMDKGAGYWDIPIGLALRHFDDDGC